MRLLSIIFLVLLSSLPLLGQVQQSNVVNYEEGKHTVTGERLVIDTLEHWMPNPKKATMLSAALPGAGQIYNKQWWKVPFIYAGLGTIGYFIYWNNDRFVRYNNAYIDFVDDDPSTNRHLDLLNGVKITNEEWFKTTVENGRKNYRRDRDLLIISMVGFYVLNVLEANVAAHLYDFDVSDDLSMQLRPSMGYNNLNGKANIGLSLSFNINK